MTVDRWTHFKSLLARPVDAASLAFFRIAVGLIMTLEAVSLLRPSASTGGAIMLETFYTGADVKFHFPYPWFEWLPVLPNAWIYAVVVLLGVSGMTLALGLCYRLSAVLVFLSWGYLYAVESVRSYWMSYYYLELLITFLLIWMPAARKFSLDAKLFKQQAHPKTVPFWTLFLLRGQLVITYFYAGAAKLNADWLLDAQPVRDFLARSPFIARFGSVLSPRELHLAKKILESDQLAYFLSYTGALFDLSIGALLLFRRTRTAGFVLMICFHLTNLLVLFDNLVWFPLLGILTATIFLDPDWPGQLLCRLQGKFKSRQTTRKTEPALPIIPAVRPILAALVVLWLSVQTLIPLRQYLIAADARFTWEGLTFSWRLKTEWYRSVPFEMSVSDPAIITRDADGGNLIAWDQWHGRKAIFRTVNPEKLDWSILPEIVVLFEPKIGERIIYNPLSGSSAVQMESAARARVEAIWRELYGRAPASVHPTAPYPRLAQACAAVFRNHNEPVSSNPDDNVALYVQRFGLKGNGEGMPALRRAFPFVLQQRGAAVSAPFLVIEDPPLFRESQPHLLTINTDAWKSSPAAGSQNRYRHRGGEPLVIYTAGVSFAPETRKLFPQFCMVDSLDSPTDPPKITCDILAELSPSQAMHVSTNPFLLQRYARHVATLWEKEYQRRPAIYAKTGVSLNRRPVQLLVDPSTDLASVRVSHLRHNTWIEDLKLARIPEKNVTSADTAPTLE
jgi:vitamin K-dependent gamma-carboxylase